MKKFISSLKHLIICKRIVFVNQGWFEAVVEVMKIVTIASIFMTGLYLGNYNRVFIHFGALSIVSSVLTLSLDYIYKRVSK